MRLESRQITLEDELGGEPQTLTAVVDLNSYYEHGEEFGTEQRGWVRETGPEYVGTFGRDSDIVAPPRIHWQPVHNFCGDTTTIAPLTGDRPESSAGNPTSHRSLRSTARWWSNSLGAPSIPL